MTQWSPVWLVEIDGVAYTNAVLANLTISTGRRNLYEQAQAGYVNLQLLDANQAVIPVHINSSISVQVKDTANVYVPIFGGTVVDIGIEVRDVGSTMFTQTYSITALGALSRLQKKLTDGVLHKDFDGDQIAFILNDALSENWAAVPAAEQWQNYDPVETWATAKNVALGDIDQPGDFELALRTSNRTDVYSLVSALATSGFGYIYEDALGRISYADASHRSNYLSVNGYVDLTANQARAAGLRVETRAGDVRNSVTLKYGATSAAEVSASDASSISTYGTLSQIVTTTLHDSADATLQAQRYLSLRQEPRAIFSSITFDLTNPELDDADRDNLINCFMGEAIAITDLPTNMGGTFQGFVEGWSFQASYNQLSITLNLTPVAYSLVSQAYYQVSPSFLFLGVLPTLDYARATIVV